jgi:hypothetical protein
MVQVEEQNIDPEELGKVTVGLIFKRLFVIRNLSRGNYEF